MVTYASDKLGHVPSTASREHLVGVIANKANGIFLWVVLVVKSVRNEVENGVTDFNELAKLVDALPEELDDLYQHIFQSMTRETRRRAYWTLAMVTKANEEMLAITPVGYSFLLDYESGRECIMRESFPKIRESSPDDRFELGHKYLRGWCGGLLKLAATRDGSNVIQYSHRSIPEFLEGPKVIGELKTHFANIDLLDAITQLMLADIRVSGKHCHAAKHISRLVHARLGDREPFSFLEALELAARDWDQTALNNHRMHNGSVAYTLQSDEDDLGWTVEATTLSPQDESIYPSLKHLPSPLYACLQLPKHPYPLWKIKNDTELPTVPLK
ncbi:hypothetical protein OQA88_10254 [Cercophora sp. LCS_1]